METILAIVVASAVIFFGALISIGNERQRKAIDDLREQVVNWAIQDLKIKHSNHFHDVQMVNPVDWLNRLVSNRYGHDLKLQLIECFEEPLSIVCASDDGTKNIIFTTHSPTEIRDIKRNKSGRLTKFSNYHPLFSLPRSGNSCEFSTLNGGDLFDLEISIVWKELTGRKWESANKLWAYYY